MNGKANVDCIFYVQVIIHHEFVPEKQTINYKFHKETIKDWSLEFTVLGLSFRNLGPGIFGTTIRRRIFGAFSPSFWRNAGSPFYPIQPTPMTEHRLTFIYFLN
jgi:hypothetical protein